MAVTIEQWRELNVKSSRMKRRSGKTESEVKAENNYNKSKINQYASFGGDSFNDDTNALLDDLQNLYTQSSNGWVNTDTYSDWQKKIDQAEKNINKAKNYYSEYSDNYGTDNSEYFNSLLETLDSAKKNISKYSDFYGNWEDTDSYSLDALKNKVKDYSSDELYEELGKVMNLPTEVVSGEKPSELMRYIKSPKAAEVSEKVKTLNDQIRLKEYEESLRPEEEIQADIDTFSQSLSYDEALELAEKYGITFPGYYHNDLEYGPTEIREVFDTIDNKKKEYENELAKRRYYYNKKHIGSLSNEDLKTAIDELTYDNISSEDVEKIAEKYGIELPENPKKQKKAFEDKKAEYEDELKQRHYNEIPECDDFGKYSQVDTSEKEDPFDNQFYNYINDVGDTRDQVKNSHPSDSISITYNQMLKTAGQMNEDEVAKYNYIHAKEGFAAANEYLDYLISRDDDSLNMRLGEEIYTDLKDEAFGKYLYSLQAGTEQFATGVVQLFSSEPIPVTATQYASEKLRDDMPFLGKAFYDIGTSVSNMAPSVMAGLINPYLGLGTMFMSTTGNAINSALKQGYSIDQARKYGVLIGATETAMQGLLGGISELGGFSSAKLISKLDGISNGLLKFIGKVGISALSEAGEEGLEEIVEPMIRTIVLDEEFDVDFEDVAYSAFVGLLSGGLFKIGNLSVEHLNNKINSKSGTNSREKGTDEFTKKYLGETGKDYFEGVKDLNSLREKLRVLSNNETNTTALKDILNQFDLQKANLIGQQITAENSVGKAGAKSRLSAEAQRALELYSEAGKAGISL